MDAMDAKERLRERTALQYFDLYTISQILDSPPQSKPETPLHNLATAAPDTALTSFAQLTAFRLSARRCLISLFDTKRQYVIAEATRSLPLRADSKTRKEEGDELWLSRIAISRGNSICDHVLSIASETEDVTELSPRHASRQSSNSCVSVIPDLGEDDRFSRKPNISTYPHNRFYAGCPIRTARGVDIGVLCVLDSEPRPPGLDEAQVEFMIDMAETVMRHLEANKASIDSRRNERMVRGIGSFVEGSSTLSGWWSNMDTASFQSNSGVEGTLDEKQQDLAQRATIHPESGREMSPADPTGGEPIKSPSLRKSIQTGPILSHTSHREVTSSTPSQSIARPTLSRQNSKRVLSPSELHNQAIQVTFAKAANLIRESLEVEGVVFLDARISSFGGMVEEGQLDSHSSDSDGTAGTASNTEAPADDSSSPVEPEQLCKLLAFASSDKSTINDASSHGLYPVTESSLKAFIRRYPTGKIFTFDAAGVLQSSESEGSEPSPKLEIADPISATSKRPSILPRKRKLRRRSRINDAAAILEFIPGARSAAFFPLWDSDRQRWFAGGIAWTRKPHRPFSIRGELSYLSAFGNTMMSQIARLDALAVEKTKTDLLSSFSHELRSPLHGVLGGVEMLSDTAMDSFQIDVLHTIETCGRTLLDTMDHLLDFTGINNFTRVRKSNKPNKSARARGGRASKVEGQYTIESGMMKIFADVDLDILVEEVAESIFAGHMFFAKTSDGQQLSPSRERSESDAMTQESNVAIILDIDYLKGSDLVPTELSTRNWSFHLNPGAFRRIVMNLFANAIKYTDHGSIRVSLYTTPSSNRSSINSPTDDAKSGSEPTADEVVLRISDTGRGISADFLNNQLFLPFTQEDRLNPGTGLGLSIVRQIVDSLNGTINVHSNIGVGTDIIVQLPLLGLERAPARDTLQRENDHEDFEDHINATKGLRIALVGFSSGGTAEKGQSNTRPQIGDRRGSYETTSSQWSLPCKEIEDICRARLGIEILPAPASPKDLFEMNPRPELLLTTENHIEQLVTDLTVNPSTERLAVIPPIVVVCRNIAVAKAKSNEWDVRKTTVDFISQPCGPRKLSKAFAFSMMRWAEEKNQDGGSNLSAEEPSSNPDVSSADKLTGPPTSANTPPVFSHPPPSFTTALPLESDLGSVRSLRQEMSLGERNGHLLVEDNAINLRILVSFMTKKKLSHDTAGNGLVALELYMERHRKYRFILMDISMPVMTGLEASREIRNFERANDLEPVMIVALTALASENVQQEAFASGIDLFLTKPVRLKELGDIIDPHAA